MSKVKPENLDVPYFNHVSRCPDKEFQNSENIHHTTNMSRNSKKIIRLKN